MGEDEDAHGQLRGVGGVSDASAEGLGRRRRTTMAVESSTKK